MKQSLQDLAKQLHEAIERLGAGEASIDDLVPLTDTAREVYERLIALRYVAIEREVKREDDEQEEAQPFRLTPALPGQTSLIDAIEEVINGDDDKKDLNAEETPADPEPEEEPVFVEAPAKPAKEAPKEEQAPKVASEKAPAKEVKPTPKPVMPQSVSDKMRANTDAHGRTVADRLRQTPIEDLRKAIGLNQKFQFINDLFSGDSTRYNLLIDEVNSADSLKDALGLLAKADDRLNSPDEEDRVATTLVQLVERRFL